LATGWWALYRAPALLARSDNPRRAISDRSVRRGALLDRHGIPVQVTAGSSGEYARMSLYPDLGSVAGYSSPLYGQSGLEAGLDEILRGLQGNPYGLVWWNELLYGQPPPGRDVRLSLDMDLQSAADEWLSGRRGALVLLEARSGEILAMASHPAFDANRLEQDWDALITDPDSPLLNRAAQGQYSLGAALGPLLYARAIEAGALPPMPEEKGYTLDGYEYMCASGASAQARDWSEALRQGCPGAAAALGRSLGVEQLETYYQLLGLYESPRLRLPVAQALPPSPVADAENLALGQDLQLSPLQLALAAAAISAEGVRPAPLAAISMDAYQQGWQPLAALDVPRPVLLPEAARRAAADLAPEGQDAWESVAVVPGALPGAYTWYLGGAGAVGESPAYVLVLLLEEEDPQLAQRIGRAVLAAAMEP
jgi:peptidoglycan glycosyltransferase